MTAQRYTAVSLFSGAGGMDMGFETEGFHVIFATDFDADSCITHRNWSNAEILHVNIADFKMEFIPDSDIILGGFPCQGFSLAGPRILDDKRNGLYYHFVRIVEAKQPKLFVAENVKGLLTLGNGVILQTILWDFANKGYIVSFQLLNAAGYGVPRDRYRIILVGIRNDLSVPFSFSPTYHVIKLANSKLDECRR